jgi:hypothetical protein
MQKIYFLVAALALSATSLFGQQYEWGKNFGGIGDESVRAIAVDDDGNTYLTGYFTDNADFDPNDGTAELVSNGFYDAFIQKIDSDGNLVWVKSIGGEFFEYGTGIEVDSDGAVLVTGVYNETVDFDPGEGVVERTSNGGEDIFALKLDSNGDFLWVFTAGSEGYEEPVSINSDANGNVYVGGYFSQPIDFQIGLSTITIQAQGGQDGFGFKLDAFGQPIWALSFGGPDIDLCLGMDVNAAGDVFYTGFYSETADFDPGDGEQTLSSIGGSNGYLLKLNALGEFIHVTDFGGTNNEIPWDVALDQNDNAFVAGGFRGSFVAGDIVIEANELGDDEAFVIKVNPFGGIDWAGSCGANNSYQSAYDVATDNEGNVIIAGYFDGTADFDPSDEGTFELTKESSEPYDSFVAKFNSEGDFLFAGNMGGTNFIEHHGVDADANGNIYLAATFQNTVNLNPFDGDEDIRSVQEFRDIFLIKVNPIILSDGLSNQQLEQITIYPNPAAEFIVVNGNITSQKIYRIYDQVGKLVQEGQIRQDGERISLNDLNSGVYLINLEGFESLKFFKD